MAALFLGGTRSGRGVRAARPQPARRVPAQSSARARWRAALGRYRAWFYVARGWRQNSNEQAWLEARLLPAASQVRPGRTRRPGMSVGFSFAAWGGPSLCSTREVGLAGAWREWTPGGRCSPGERNWRVELLGRRKCVKAPRFCSGPRGERRACGERPRARPYGAPPPPPAGLPSGRRCCYTLFSAHRILPETANPRGEYSFRQRRKLRPAAAK